MKKIFYITLAVPFVFTGCSPKIVYTSAPPQPVVDQQPVYDQPQQVADDQPQTDQEFYDQLSPYGNWINYPNYGYVWQPNVDADFAPYSTNGNWVYSDAGWTWVSGYSWGWAPFHYGRWFNDSNYGWLWVPGHDWAPAWVTWGQSGDYYGWAPVPPRENAGSNWRPRDQDWNFVPARHITQVNVNNYVVRNNVTVIKNVLVINNITNNRVTNNVTNNNINRHAIYNMGPKVNEVENITNTKIQRVTINVNNRPGQTSVNNNQISVYRPDLNAQKKPDNNTKPTPQTVYNPVGGKLVPANNRGGQAQKPGQPNQPPANEKGNNQNPRPGNGQVIQNPNQQPGQQNNGQQPQKATMGQNPNAQFINRPITVPPNTNEPKPQNAKPVAVPANNPNNNQPKPQNPKPVTVPANNPNTTQQKPQNPKPVTVPASNTNQPKPQNPKPVTAPPGNPNNNLPGNKKPDTSKRHVKKVMTPASVKQQN